MRRVGAVLFAAAVVAGSLVLPGPLNTAASARPADVWSRIPTTDPVVFITIDDGFSATPAAERQLGMLAWPIVNFLTSGALAANYDYFRDLTPWVLFGTHTRHHRKLTELDEAGQRAEICGGADDTEAIVGVRPVWFRPPGGNYDDETLQVAGSCGIRALLMWRVTVNGTTVRTWGGPIRRGDIILLHYRKDLAESLRALQKELDAVGLYPAQLEHYLRFPAAPRSTRRVSSGDDGCTTMWWPPLVGYPYC
jgi:peptidoglycan/xylan/chitin deacetylase (PgdA/CDA1 family)